MYEKKHQPLAPRTIYYKRIMSHSIQASAILLLMLVIGTVGYHYATEERMDWWQALHNASMILSGMGPIVEEKEKFTHGGVIFSSLYAIFSGVIFISSISYILAPAVHRLFHRLHLEEK